MATFEPWEIGNTLHNVGSHSAAALNADIVTLTAAKGTLEIIPVKVLSSANLVVTYSLICAFPALIFPRLLIHAFYLSREVIP